MPPHPERKGNPMPRSLVVPLVVAALAFPPATGRGAPPPPAGTNQAGQPMQAGPQLFLILPPVPTADPAVRSEKAFRVPGRLRVCRLGRYVGVEAVPGAPEAVQVSVGKDMVTGLRYEVSVHRAGKLVLSGPGGMQSRSDGIYAEVAATVGEVGSKDFQPGQRYQATLRLTLFETDIPPQHCWAPETGRY